MVLKVLLTLIPLFKRCSDRFHQLIEMIEVYVNNRGVAEADSAYFWSNLTFC